MRLILRLVVIVVALICAVAAAMIFAPVASLFDETTRQAGARLAEGLFELLADSFGDDAHPQRAAGLVFAVWSGVMAVCALPVLFTAIVGELVRASSFLWHVGGAGALAAAVPWIMRARVSGGKALDSGMNDAEARVTLLLFLTGCVAGLVYWLIAGRNAGRVAGR